MAGTITYLCQRFNENWGEAYSPPRRVSLWWRVPIYMLPIKRVMKIPEGIVLLMKYNTAILISIAAMIAQTIFSVVFIGFMLF